MKEPADTFASRLRDLLQARGLTAYALAQKSGVRQQTLSKLLMGERQPMFDTVCRLADALGLPLDTFRPRKTVDFDSPTHGPPA
jgi:transcriptional regulator with XRE-family HTH domain